MDEEPGAAGSLNYSAPPELHAGAIILRNDPQNAIARYRYGRVLMAQRQNTEALAQLESAANSNNPATPPTIIADAALAAGRLREIAQDRTAALAHYRHAADLFGASTDTRNAARRAITRLEKLSPADR